MFQLEPVTVPLKELIWQVRSPEASGELPLPSPYLVIKLKQAKETGGQEAVWAGAFVIHRKTACGWDVDQQGMCVGLLESTSPLGHDLIKF